MRPAWLDNGLVMLSNHEPLTFRIRRGGQSVDAAEQFVYEHSEDFVKRAAAFGITCLRTHYYKGGGLKYEGPEMQMTKKFIRLAHKYGIRVQGYVQHGTLTYETLFAEESRAANWVARDQYGLKSSVTYGYQFFRYKPCYNQRGFVEYIKKVVRKGIADGLDMFGFDNSAWSVEPVACQCDACRRRFRQFLARKYNVRTTAGRCRALARFAMTDFRHVEPPNWHRWAMPINLFEIQEPMIQEWVDFKCECMRANIAEIDVFAKKLKPDVVMEWNCYSAFGDNGPFWVGVDIYRNMAHVDAVYNEQDPHPGINADGVLLNMIRSFKLFQGCGRYMLANCNYHARSAAELNISFAEHLAFNSGMIGMLPGGFNADAVDSARHPDTVKHIRFSAEHRDILAGVSGAADTAVLESYDTLAHTRIDPHHSLVAVYQTLITGNVPFDILTLDRLGELDRYRLLVLPNVKLLAGVHIDRLLEWVARGGKLLVTEQTGLCDEWFRRRAAPYFADKTGRRGKGEIRNIPKIDHERDFSYKPEDWFIDTRMWKLPKNYAAILKTVRSMLGRDTILNLKPPKGLVTNLCVKDGVCILHAINYSTARKVPATQVRLNLPSGVQSIAMVSPCEGERKKVPFRRSGRSVTFSTGGLERYKVFVIRTRS